MVDMEREREREREREMSGVQDARVSFICLWLLENSCYLLRLPL